MSPGGVPTLQIVIPANQSTGSVVLTGLADNLNEGQETIVASIASAINAAIPPGVSASTLLLDKQVPITFETQDVVTPEGTTANVVVTLSQPLPFQVSVDYQINPGTALNGINFLPPNGQQSRELPFE